MKYLKEKNAITLIALVITIVVLIILATVAINLSLGNNGIFNRAKSAKEQYSNATQYEKGEVAKSSNNIDSYLVGGARNDTQYDIIFEYDASVANKKADHEGTYSLNLGSGKTSVNDYKYLMVFAQTNGFETESSSIIYNFPNRKITNHVNAYQYSNSVYYGSYNHYCVRYIFDNNSFTIGSITYTGWSYALIREIIGVY